MRNSWGTDFGNNGYLYIKYGENVCGKNSFFGGGTFYHIKYEENVFGKNFFFLGSRLLHQT